MTTDKQIKYPRFLENKPCGKDLFKDQSHDNIAENIVEIINDNEANIIGLEGCWGSGKSNMINLIKSKLDNKKFHFFIYDAWGYQTDQQKRSILENLTSFLIKEELINDEGKWKTKLHLLLSRKQSISTKIIKEISVPSQVALIASVSSPILIAIGKAINISTYICTPILISLWVLLLLILFVRLQIINMKKHNQPTDLKNVIKESYLNIIGSANKTDNIEGYQKYETIYDEEPSSRDFREWMKDINKDIKENILIIVFDNMDRLPHAKIQELWSSIHTFFSEETYSKIKVIVPFDRTHIGSAFKNNINIENKNFGNDYINKTFNVIYQVAPPIMTNWKNYFMERWFEAFGEGLNPLTSKVIQIYDLLSTSPTPREIIAFINEFVSIQRVTKGIIPEEYIALFILGKTTIQQNPFKEIIDPTYINNYKFLYDKNAPKFISALYYQLNPEKALDIVYVEKIRKDLSNNNSDSINEISNSPFFDNLLENAITNLTNIPNATLALNRCSKSVTQRHWNCLQKQLNTKETTLQEYQLILLKKISNKDEYLKKIITDFYHTASFDAIKFSHYIDQLAEIKEIDPFQYLETKILEPNSFVEFVNETKENYKKYKITCNKEYLDSFLSNIDINFLEQYTILPYINNEYKNLELYRNQLYSLIDNNRNNKNNLYVIFNRLKEIERPIQKTISDADIYERFRNCTNNEPFYFDLICMRIARLQSFSASYQTPFNSILNNTDETFVNQISSNIEFFMNYGDILLNASKYPLLTAIAKRITEQKPNQSKLNLLTVLQNYPNIINTLQIEPKTLIGQLNYWDPKEITIDNINLIPYNFYKDSTDIDNKLTSHCKNTCIKYLEQVDEDTWIDNFYQKGDLYKLLDLWKIMPQQAYEAFTKVIKNKILDESINFALDTYDNLKQISTKEGRSLNNTFKSIRDLFCLGKAIMTNNLFKFIGKDLLENAKLEENPNSLRTILIPSLLDDEGNIQLILNKCELIKQLINNAKEDSKDFEDKVNNLVNNDYKDNKDFEDFANYIGIKKLEL